MDHGNNKNSFYDFAKKCTVYPTFNLKDYETCVNEKGDTKSKAILFFLSFSLLLLGSVVEFNTKPFSGNNWRRNSMLAKKSLQKLVQDVEKIYINLHCDDDFRATTMCANIFK